VITIKDILMRTLTTLIFLFAISLDSYSATIEVPKDYSTIQAAIDAAVSDDTVLVAPGTYVENINFRGKAITLTSSGGPNNTFIDGNYAGSVVTFNSGEGVSSILNGFTITKGFNSIFGGGVYCESSPTITNNIISGNSASKCGGGIFCFKLSTPTIYNNTISWNSAGGEMAGGGIFCYNASPIITHNTIN